MRFEWTPSQQRDRDLFRDFARTEIEPGAAGRDAVESFDPALWRRLAELGFWRAQVPRQYDGRGGSLWDFVAGFEGLAGGTTDFSFLLSAVAHAGLIQVLLDHGTGAQRARCLPVLIGGGVGATAATERGGGSHVSAIATRARAAGDAYLLSGEKVHITNAPIADIVLVVGRLPAPAKRDITLFLVYRDQHGVTLGRHETLMGHRSSPTGAVTLHEARVTRDDIVGEPGGGLDTLYWLLSFDRMMYGLLVAGVLGPLIDMAMRHAETRTAFGAPLAEHEYIQDKIVDMRSIMEASRWLAYGTVWALCAREPACSLRSSVAKLVASEGIVRAGLELIQIFGHRGYDREVGVERILRDAVALRLAGGSTEMQKKNIFKHVHQGHLGGTEPGAGSRTGDAAERGEGRRNPGGT